MATLKDVAALSGVSIATVSYVINGSRPVKAETRYRVLDAIRQLNYIPNSLARNLKCDISNEIGVVIPNIEDYCRSEILKGIVASLSGPDYSLNIAFSNGIEKLEQQIIDNFISKNIRGLILLTCQPDNTEYFRDSIIKHNIPNVFLENFPLNIDANFLAFDNYSTIYFITQRLIRAGYEDLALFTGDASYFSEANCVMGFTDALDDMGVSFPSDSILSAKNSKEVSFRIAAEYFSVRHPQAVITSSGLIAKGVMEAASLLNLKPGKDLILITLGEECWNKSNYDPCILHTSRTAYTLGTAAVKTLLRSINASEFLDKEFMLFKDSIMNTSLPLPPPPKKQTEFPPVHNAPRELSVICTDLPTLRAAETIAAEFAVLHDVALRFEYKNYEELMMTIQEDSRKQNPSYDIYLHDVSWLPFLAQEKALMDITDFIKASPEIQRRFLSGNLKNCNFRGRYYGIPIVGGTHLLFYRKDLFEDSKIQRQFKAQHQISLRPPRTWAEFNGIAKFFTRSFTPDSPTEFGTFIGIDIPEACVLEYLIRMWSYGGSLANRNRRLDLASPQNEKALISFLESCRYSPGDIFNQSIDDSFRALGNGTAAMIISYTEYAAQIQDYIQGNIITKIGYAMVPGLFPANVGWNLGISPNTKNLPLIGEFFKWLCTRHVSYYMTILSGQSVVNYPYANHEILKLYPWLNATSEGMKHAVSRNFPYQGQNRNIAPYELARVVSKSLQKAVDGELAPAAALEDAQKNLLKLFSS